MKWVSFLGVSLLILSQSVFADLGWNEEYGRTTRTVSRSGKDLDGNFRMGPFQISSTVYRNTREWKQVRVRYWHCEDGAGTGNNWGGFYPAANSPSKLSNAVKGIGPSTARRLIRENVFRSRPRSWSEFARRIRSAGNRYETGFDYEVLHRFGELNRKNLGYWGERCETRWRTEWRWVPVRRPVGVVTRSISIVGTGAALLSHERESFRLVLVGPHAELGLPTSFNNYTVVNQNIQGDRVTFEVRAERKRVRPRNRLNVALSKRDGRLHLTVTDNDFDRQIAEQAQNIRIKGEVKVKKGWWNPNRGDVIATINHELSTTSATTRIDLGEDSDKNEFRVNFKVQYEGSRYYSDRESTTRHETFDLE